MTIEKVTCTTLEFHDDQANSHKYYRTYQVGKKAVYQWGRINAVGQWSAADHMEEWSCRSAITDKLVEKRGKGYVDSDTRTFDFDSSRLTDDKTSLHSLDMNRQASPSIVNLNATSGSTAAPKAKPAPAPAPSTPVVDALNPHAVFAARALAAISLAVTDPQAAAVEFAILNDSWKDLEMQHAKAASYLNTLDQLLIGAHQ